MIHDLRFQWTYPDLTMERARQPADHTVVDLFCGAGGLTLGLEAAGLRSVLASDHWSAAAETFSQNFPETPMLQADARDLDAQVICDKGGVDRPSLIVGGPPCQGFSSAGARRGEDPRNNLVSVFGTLVAETLPRAFVFENVEGFLTLADGAFLTALLDPLFEAGYQIWVRKLNVANFGVPQLRKRVLCVGMLDSVPPALAPTHRAHGAPGAHLVGRGLPSSPNIMDALDGLPRPSKEPPGWPSGHVVPRLSDTDRERIAILSPGQTMRDLPPELQHASYLRRANRRVGDGTPTEKRGGAPAGLRRLVANEPSKAITGAAQREMIHPTEDRALTLRECARLQTFPDSFEFAGPLMDQRVLVGNAVPPRFAEVLGTTLLEALDTPEMATSGTGRIVSFDGTNSSGRSPALAAVEALVASRYGSLGRYVEASLWD